MLKFYESNGNITVKIPNNLGHVLESITFTANNLKNLEFWNTHNSKPLVCANFNPGTSLVSCVFNGKGLRASDRYEFRLVGDGMKQVVGNFIKLSPEMLEIWGK